MRPWKSKFLAVLPLLLFLTVWYLFGSSSKERRFFYSTPADVVLTAWSCIVDGTLPNNMFVTGFEAISGFILGNLVGAALGISLWYSRTLAVVARPYLVALASLPVFAIAPITILWFGIGIPAKIALAFLATVFLATSQSYKGVEQVDNRLIQQFRLFNATKWGTFRWLLIPSSTVWVINSLRLTIGAALLGAFIGEFIASERGLGHFIIRASGLYDTPRVLVGVIAIVLMAITLDRLIDHLEKWALGAVGVANNEKRKHII
jgi:NitT/TauT family transport system permease protein